MYSYLLKGAIQTAPKSILSHIGNKDNTFFPQSRKPIDFFPLLGQLPKALLSKSPSNDEKHEGVSNTNAF